MKKLNIFLAIYQVVCIVFEFVSFIILFFQNIGLGGWIIFGLLSVFAVITCILSNLYVENDIYLQFIEYLFNNENNPFILMPRISLYMRQKKIQNKIHVEKMEVIYNIDAEEYRESKNPLKADVTQVFRLTIRNKSLPKAYNLCIGNAEVKTPPNIRIKYGMQKRYNKINEMKNNRDEFDTAFVRYYRWNLNPAYIPNQNTLPLILKLRYKGSFDFSKKDPHIVIFYPKAYANRIDNVKYTFNFKNFPDGTVFSIKGNIIERQNNEYKTTEMVDVEVDEALKKVIRFVPIKRRCQSAYYFQLKTMDEI